MYKEKKILAIIPARSGSIGVKDKNIKILNGKPLIYYSIKQALDSKIFDEVFVSTDSENYKAIAEKEGASVPFLRPNDISRESSRADEYIVHTINEFKNLKKEFSYFCVLQPTSPLRSSCDIINCANLIITKNLDCVVSVCEAKYPVQYFKELPEDLNLYKFSSNTKRQDFQKTYRINGAIYFCKCDVFLKHRDFYVKKSRAYIMDRKSSIDIDEELDFKIADFFLRSEG